MPGLQTNGLGEGYVNSWIEHYIAQSNPCISDTVWGGSTDTEMPNASCVLWLIAGLVIGSIVFKKKGAQQ